MNCTDFIMACLAMETPRHVQCLQTSAEVLFALQRDADVYKLFKLSELEAEGYHRDLELACSRATSAKVAHGLAAVRVEKNVAKIKARMKDPEDPTLDRARLHLRFGWWSLLVFMTLGLMLEALHAFKMGVYLDVSSETRRLLWTLAHAHGALPT